MNKGISTAACILVIFWILISFSGCKKINVREVVSSKDNADIQNELDDREKNDSRVDSLPHNSESNEIPSSTKSIRSYMLIFLPVCY